MKLVVFSLLCALCLTIYLAVNGFWAPEYGARIRLINSSNCTLQSLKVSFPHMNAIIPENKLLAPSDISDKEEAFITLWFSPLESEYNYTVEANFKDCPTITSSERTIKPSWYKYEWIHEDKINSEIRATY